MPTSFHIIYSPTKSLNFPDKRPIKVCEIQDYEKSQYSLASRQSWSASGLSDEQRCENRAEAYAHARALAEQHTDIVVFLDDENTDEGQEYLD